MVRRWGMSRFLIAILLVLLLWPGIAATAEQPALTGFAGNPKLKPYAARSLDLSYEKYFAKKAYVSASLFYKDLKTYIYKQTVDGVDYSQLTSILPPGYAKVPVSPTGFLTIPLNGKGGRLDGIELTASAPGELLTDWLAGFGAILSVSQTDSSIRVPALTVIANVPPGSRTHCSIWSRPENP